jgi:hypothetical protein
VRIVEGQRGRNLTVSLAVSPTLGLVHYSFHERFRKEEMTTFVCEVSVLLADEGPHVFLCDNAAAHGDAEAAAAVDQNLRRLPRYSPFINVAEYANSALKAAVKRELAHPHVQARLSDRQLAADLLVSRCISIGCRFCATALSSI